MQLRPRRLAWLLVPLAAGAGLAIASPAFASAGQAPTIVAVSSSGTLAYGNLVNLKALVYPTDGGGTVRFAVDGATIPGCGAVGFGSGGGDTWQAICSTYVLSQGTHTITATYSGDTGYAGSSGTMQQTIDPSPGYFVGKLLSGANPNLTLSVEGASTSINAHIIQSTVDGTGDDIWVFKPVAGGYQIINGHSGMCVTTTYTAGADLIQLPCVGVPNQTWLMPGSFTSGGYRFIWDANTNMYFDVYGGSTAAGAHIDSFPYNGWYPNQLFLPVPAA
ncbi:RICIN domain-containing protein [Dactylosporangium sp. NPDC051485]|uniref:RICIN domain-containing protein n=1 Tax=Dactylosporangium sp. NPDC051485 TaxID=3154846 RepID=UPI0034350935